MAGGRTWRQYVEARTNGQPEWSPGLMAGGSSRAAPRSSQSSPSRNGAPA